MRLELFTADVPKIQPFLEPIFQDGGKKHYSIKGFITTIHNDEGMSGFEYREEAITAQLTVGLLLGGTGYSLKRIVRNGTDVFERYDYFNIQGECTFTSDRSALKSIIVDFHVMDLSCPILNHFYNYLSLEYKNASMGKSQTALVHSVETFLRSIYRSDLIALPIKNRANDPAIVNVYNKFLATEMDPVLTWEERHIVFDKHKEELQIILETKTRAHKLSLSNFKLSLFAKSASNFFSRFIARPNSNAKGLLYKYSIGKVVWFFQTVRNNLGYSIALAVYGPFTYYFITMPMNPHAMQAVGRVRTTYLEVKTTISNILDRSENAFTSINNKEAIASSASRQIPEVTGTSTSDSVKSVAAAPEKKTDNPALANIINPSKITTNTGKNFVIRLDGEATEEVGSSFLNMLLTTDSNKVNKTNWSERMSNFKQLQIAYEENIEYASRTGRLEQLETQYNFPMQIEATWEELERYNTMIFKLRQDNPNMSAKMKQYLFNEINRTQQLELYLWDRLSRFILDQVYVMLDQDKEQKRSDYYVGRSFVFMEEMTNILSWRYKDLKKPEGYEKIQALALAYSKARKEAGTVLKNLQANSDLFKQKDIYDTKEFRGHMKRQWEILFLQNAKAEEASNMGLNMYIWSVRNTAWILQSLFSAKREELAILVKRDVSGQLLSPSEVLSRSKISMMYETLVHNLTLEYVGIREEIKNRIGKDIESTQRMTVIENLKEFLNDRDKLDNLGTTIGQKTARTKI